jgi:hypothetical protein
MMFTKMYWHLDTSQDFTQATKLYLQFQRDLQTTTVKEDIHHYISQYSACLSVHTNYLVVNLMAQQDNNRWLWRHYPMIELQDS